MRNLAIRIGTPLLVSIGVVLALVVAAHAECGKASWYKMGHTTASGAKFRPLGLSFAMRSRDFGKVYAVTYRGKTVPAVHNDFGPAAWTGRRYDLSEGLAAALGMKHRGVAVVCVTRLR